MSEEAPSNQLQTLSSEIAELAKRITELQRGWTNSREERAILDAFLGIGGPSLTELKNAVDSGDEYHTLHQLVYHDIDDAQIRAQLIAHFAAHGQPRGELKILSDIDDTFYCNWIDTRYPKKTPYPGVRALYRELDLGHQEKGRLGDLAFLTARPYDRLGTTDKLTHKMLRGYGVTHATILPGDFLHLLTNQLIAEAKHHRFLEFQPLFPEYEYVFLGDSGQGDVAAGRLMLGHGSVRAVFIHDVVKTPEEERRAQRQHRVFFHDTYIGAATAAFEQSLLNQSGLMRVAAEAVRELAAIQFENAAQHDAIYALFQRDLAACNEHLDASARIALYAPTA